MTESRNRIKGARIVRWQALFAREWHEKALLSATGPGAVEVRAEK